MQIFDRMNDFDRLVPQFIRRADDVPCLHASTSEEHRLGARVVIATDRYASASMMVVRAAAKFTQPND